MCHKMMPLLMYELRAALDEMARSNHARVPRRSTEMVVPDAYPGQQVPLFVSDDAGNLCAVELTWGFAAPAGGTSKLVFNTRIETALSQARSGEGLWADAILHGRCLVPVRGFYERWTRSEERRPEVRFTLPGRQVFLLAGVCQDGRFSVVTTRPNADVAPVHQRMPLVLGPGESSAWLGEGFPALADRSGIRLEATPKCP